MDKRQRAQYLVRVKKGILAECVLVVMAVAVLAGQQSRLGGSAGRRAVPYLP